MRRDLAVVVSDNPASETARVIAELVRAALADRGAATLAVSGGSTAPPMLSALEAADLDWGRVEVWQVDERCAPAGDEDRNANQLAGFPATVHLMPVEAADLAAAAERYAAALPERFDVVHLGMGGDGHTASWPPGDPVIDRPEPVALSEPYQGRVRMTLTPAVVNGAVARVVLVSGESKAEALRAWIDGDDDVPVSRLAGRDTTVVVDWELAEAAGLTAPSAGRRDDGPGARSSLGS